MKTTVTELGQNKAKLTVEVPEGDLRDVLQKTYRRLAKDIKIPGFRPGKVPAAVIDQRLGRDYVRSEALREALPDIYTEAIDSTDLDVVAPPEIDVTTFEDGQDLTFEATVETRPVPVLGAYDGLEVARPSSQVNDDEIDAHIEQLQTRFATLEITERPLSDGDFASVDLTTSHHDETIDEMTAKDLLLEVGAAMVLPELDAELRGKRKGDMLKLNVTLPEQFGERAGLAVTMNVLVKESKKRVLPDLDDDFATTVSEFDTLDELRTDITQRLGEMREAEVTNAVRERTLDAFVEVVSADLPEGMVNVELDGLLTGLVRMLAAQGVTLEQYLASQEVEGPELRERFQPQAERNIKVRLGLDALAEAESLEVTQDDRDSEMERLAQRAGRPVEEVREAIEDDWSALDGDILRAKALDLLVERAKITEEEPS